MKKAPCERTITLTMDGDKNVTATFRPVIAPEIAGVVFDPVARSVSLTWPSHPDAIYDTEDTCDITRLLGGQMRGTRPSATIQCAPT